MTTSKVKYIFGIYICLLIVSACCDSDIFNVQITEIEFVPFNSFIAEDEQLEFNLRLNDSIVGMAWNFGSLRLIQSAYAFDCDEDTFRPIATVDMMKCRVLTDFSSEFQVNDFVTELIDVRFFNWRTEKIETSSIENFFDFLRQDERATGRSAGLDNATFILTQRPTIANVQEFEIEFTFTDNSVLTTTTEQITWE